MNRQESIAEMAICTAFCTIPNIKTALIAPSFLQEAEWIHKDLNLAQKPFDIVVLDDMPQDIAAVKETMNEKGVLVCKITNNDISQVAQNLARLGEHFRIVMPFYDLNLAFASDFYHPTADIILQKADLIDEAHTYNADFHKASFVLPSWQIKKFLGIAKN